MTTIEWSLRSADTCIARHPILAEAWEYQFGVVLKGVEQVWHKTGDPKYLKYIQGNIDHFVQLDGSIRTYRAEDYNLDLIHTGTLLFDLYLQTADERYRKAIFLLRSQLEHHPRTSEGGFWHKSIYPYQMWLDGIYMASPFYARFARDFNNPAGFDDVALQIDLIERHTRDLNSGLLYHGWDETRSRPWADPQTGRSPNFWGRAIGWYGMALVDILDYFPEGHPAYGQFVQHLIELVEAIQKTQDPVTGLWHQVVDQGSRPGNYLETSASCMFVYAAAKGVRKGYLKADYLRMAKTGYSGILREKVSIDGQGWVDLKDICRVAGLSGTEPQPLRDGSFNYYVNEPVLSNDYKGVGAFILASVEMERAA